MKILKRLAICLVVVMAFIMFGCGAIAALHDVEDYTPTETSTTENENDTKTKPVTPKIPEIPDIRTGVHTQETFIAALSDYNTMQHEITVDIYGWVGRFTYQTPFDVLPGCWFGFPNLTCGNARIQACPSCLDIYTYQNEWNPYYKYTFLRYETKLTETTVTREFVIELLEQDWYITFTETYAMFTRDDAWKRVLVGKADL